MSEGRTYVMEWTNADGVWKARVRGSRRLRAEHSTLESVLDDLRVQICSRFGDGEPVFTFDPPLPTFESDEPYLRHDLAIFSGSGYVEFLNHRALKQFSGGPCTHCGYPTGIRNSVPLELMGSVSEHVAHSHDMYYSPVLVSEAFIELLTAAERDCCEWRLCVRPAGSRKKIYEALPRIFIPQAIPSRFKTTGWRCPQCDRRVHGVSDKASSLFTFVHRSQLPNPVPELFGVGDRVAGPAICGRLSRLTGLLRSRSSYGMKVSQLGLIENDEFVDTSCLPFRELASGWRLERLMSEYQAHIDQSQLAVSAATAENAETENAGRISSRSPKGRRQSMEFQSEFPFSA